jgi:hypothetical protein
MDAPFAKHSPPRAKFGGIRIISRPLVTYHIINFIGLNETPYHTADIVPN